MEDDSEVTSSKRKSSCSSTNPKTIWLMGGGVVLLAVFLCYVMFTTKDTPLPVKNAAQGSVAGQQVAFVPPNCVTCPSAPQCFPPAGGTGALPVAFVPNCAQQAGYTPGCAQPVAFMSNGMAQGGQQPVAGQSAMYRCPRCNFSYYDANALNKGFAQCPRCQTRMTVRNQNPQGFRNVALTNTGKVPPPIFRDAVMIHQFRGVCENCHIVNPDIAIPATTTQVPHGYRGVCSNCHTVLGLTGTR